MKELGPIGGRAWGTPLGTPMCVMCCSMHLSSKRREPTTPTDKSNKLKHLKLNKFAFLSVQMKNSTV